MKQPVRRLVFDNANQEELRATASKLGMLTLRDAALAKIYAGITTPHEMLRVTRGGDGHVLQASIAGGWGDVYQIAMDPQHPVDFELANWYTSTHPASRFTQNLIVARAGDHGRRFSLVNHELVERSRDDVQKRTVDTPDELLDVLATQFELDFPAGTRFGSPGAPWPA